MRRDWTIARAKVDREGECRLCGERRGLQAAHVAPRSLGGGQSEDAVVPLCGPCHHRVDAFECDWLHALTFAEQGEAVRVMGIENARRRLLPSEYESKRVPRVAALDKLGEEDDG